MWHSFQKVMFLRLPKLLGTGCWEYIRFHKPNAMLAPYSFNIINLELFDVKILKFNIFHSQAQ